MRIVLWQLLALGSLWLLGGLVVRTPPARADFALQSHDTVVFLGDSNTAPAAGYTKTVETYARLRFPDRSVAFINAGISGDTAAGGLARLQRDVFDRHATVAIVTFGINDIGFGFYGDDAHKQAYLDGIKGIVQQCRSRGVRVYIASYPVTGADPFSSETSFLQTTCDEGLALAQSLGAHTIDVQRTMRSIQQKIVRYNASQPAGTARIVLHDADGIHLNNLGHLAMAYGILKGLGAPADVSSVVVDAVGPSMVRATNASVSNVHGDAGVLTFSRHDEGMPFNFRAFAIFGRFQWIADVDQLNRYVLAVTNLPRGLYDVDVDGDTFATYTDQQLSAGVDLATADLRTDKLAGTSDPVYDYQFAIHPSAQSADRSDQKRIPQHE